MLNHHYVLYSKLLVPILLIHVAPAVKVRACGN